MVNTFEEGEKILQSCFYPPMGSRGMGLARAQGYGATEIREKYLNYDSNNIEIYFQIESYKAIENIDKIFSLPITGYFIGPYDLSASLGDPGNFTSDVFMEAEKKTMLEAEKYSLQKGYHLVEPNFEDLKTLKKRGYNKIAFSVDIRMIESISKLPFKNII